MAHKQENDIDQELNRVLDIANQLIPINVKPQTNIPAQAPVWPWQVPQAPTYTSGGSEAH